MKQKAHIVTVLSDWLGCHHTWSRNHLKQHNSSLLDIFIILIRRITDEPWLHNCKNTWRRKS